MENLNQRYLPLDVLRGMTLALMIIVNTPGDSSASYAPLLHANWNGFTLTDLVFPTFLFVVGTAMTFTMPKFDRVNSVTNADFLKKIFLRSGSIFLCGYLMFWLPQLQFSSSGLCLPAIGETRILGVLQRIALAYCIAALILRFGKEKGAITYSVVTLLGYWLILTLFGDYSLEGNAVLKLDRFILGEKHLYQEEGIPFDPEGILSTFPSVVNVLAGYFAGRIIRSSTNHAVTTRRLMLAGAVSVTLALIGDNVFPINKKLWTSSFVALTVGIDFIVLSLLVFTIEIVSIFRWTYFFEVFGKNTLFIYVFATLLVMLLARIQIGSQHLYAWLYATLFRPLSSASLSSLLFAITYMLFCWSIAFFMDKRRIYIRL